MKIIAATTNMNKVREIREILDEILSASGTGKDTGIPGKNCDNGTADISLNKIEVLSMAEVGIDADIPETGTTFEENAEEKARAVLNLLKESKKTEVSSAEIENNKKSCRINPPGVTKLGSDDIGIPNLSMETADEDDSTPLNGSASKSKISARNSDNPDFIVIADDSGLEDEKIIVIADDSGLEIDALGGSPGIHSARFMGHDTSYDLKCAAILDKMKDVPDEERTARFICAMAVAWADTSEVTQKVAAESNPHNKCKAETTSPENRNITIFRGAMEGRIAREPAGRNGFGYDPIFYLPEFGCTSAELSPEEKNSVSHRGKALRAALQYISSLHSD